MYNALYDLQCLFSIFFLSIVFHIELETRRSISVWIFTIYAYEYFMARVLSSFSFRVPTTQYSSWWNVYTHFFYYVCSSTITLGIWEIEVERDSWNVKLSRAKERYVSDKLQDSRLFTKRTELNENVSWILAFLEIKMWMWKVEENIDFQFWNSQFRSRHYQRKIFDIFSPETKFMKIIEPNWRIRVFMKILCLEIKLISSDFFVNIFDSFIL